MENALHTVIETPNFIREARDAGLTLNEVAAIVAIIAADPMTGDEISGTGGARTVRIAGRGKGKSGGYRVVTFYTGHALPVFLLALISKGERANLSKAERNELHGILKNVAAEYRKKGTK